MWVALNPTRFPPFPTSVSETCRWSWRARVRLVLQLSPHCGSSSKRSQVVSLWLWTETGDGRPRGGYQLEDYGTQTFPARLLRSVDSHGAIRLARARQGPAASRAISMTKLGCHSDTGRLLCGVCAYRALGEIAFKLRYGAFGGEEGGGGIWGDLGRLLEVGFANRG